MSIPYLKLLLVFLLVGCFVTAAAMWQGTHSFVFAWVLNFLLMTAVLYIMQTLKPRLTSRYYLTKNWEANGNIYKWLGVNLFRKLLVLVGWEKLNKVANPVKKNLKALKQLEYNTRQSEFGHLIIFVFVFCLSLWVIFDQGLNRSLWLLSLNILLNVYPIIVQRYNRPRLQRAIKFLT